MTSKLLNIDGQDGGGQILRSALSLSMITGQAFRMTNIRGKRSKPGLARQHLTCVDAAVAVSGGSADGAELKSTELVFKPGAVVPGNYEFAIGTAGSTTLLAQTLLLPLALAGGKSQVRLKGGTHNPMAPPVDFIQRAFLPQLKDAGVKADLSLDAYGFAPAGGGEIFLTIGRMTKAKPLSILDRGDEVSRSMDCIVAHVPANVAEREFKTIREELDWDGVDENLITLNDAQCGANVLSAEVAFQNVVERVTAFGAQGVRSENVAKFVAKELQNYFSSNAVVGGRLADQLLLPMAVLAGGEFITGFPGNHLKTNVSLIEKFVGNKFEVARVNDAQWRVSCGM